jgi:hypothetical protein
MRACTHGSEVKRQGSVATKPFDGSSSGANVAFKENEGARAPNGDHGRWAHQLTPAWRAMLSEISPKQANNERA